MKSLRPSRKFLFIVFIILVIAGLSSSTYYFFQRSQALLKNPTLASKEETDSIKRQLGKYLNLPKDDEPTIATVLDVAKLKSQAFFTNAKNGDKVLIFTKSMKAILFRPSEDRIIDFSLLNISTPSAQNVTPVRIAVYNGTDKVGLSQTFEKDIKAKVTNIEIAIKDNTKKDNYVKTLVVDLSGNKADVASQLAQLVGGTVSKLPEGETLPTSSGNPLDFLVILGKDYSSK